jgi:hypothetical protein
MDSKGKRLNVLQLHTTVRPLFNDPLESALIIVRLETALAKRVASCMFYFQKHSSDVTTFLDAFARFVNLSWNEDLTKATSWGLQRHTQAGPEIIATVSVRSDQRVNASNRAQVTLHCQYPKSKGIPHDNFSTAIFGTMCCTFRMYSRQKNTSLRLCRISDSHRRD